MQLALSTEEFKDGRVEVEQLLAAIIGSSQDAIISSDCDGVITVWNPGAERLYGYAASEAIGQPVRLLMPPARRGDEHTVLGRALAGADGNKRKAARSLGVSRQGLYRVLES